MGLAGGRASRVTQLHHRRRPVGVADPVHARRRARVLRAARPAGRRRGTRLPVRELAGRRAAAGRDHPPPPAAGSGRPDGAQDRRGRAARRGVLPRAGLRDQRGGARCPQLCALGAEGHPRFRAEPDPARRPGRAGRVVRAAAARRGGRGAAARPGAGRAGQPLLRVGGRHRTGAAALLPGPGARRCSSSTTTRRGTATTSTRRGATRPTTSATTCWPSTTACTTPDRGRHGFISFGSGSPGGEG